MYHRIFPSLLVLPAEELQRGSIHHLCFPLKM